MNRFTFGLIILLLCQALGFGADKATPETKIPREDGHPIFDPVALQNLKQDLVTGKAAAMPMIYHNGPVMTGQINVYYIWYGDWSTDDSIALLENFAKNIGGSPYFAINTTYTDGSGAAVRNAVTFAGSTTDNYSQGKSLSDGQIWNVVTSAITSGRLPSDPNGIYFVLTATDVTATSGFCSQYCGWHTYSTLAGVNIKFSFVGNAARCLSGCAPQSKSPNNNPGADAMASVVAHELEETVTDPNLNAWSDARGYENGDKCAWTFGLTFAAPNGSRANMTLGSYSYLIQQNWVNTPVPGCDLQYVLPTLSTISPATGTSGSTVNVTLTGSNFVSGTSNLSISGAGVSTTGLKVVSPTQITASLVVDPTAAAGPRTITVTNGFAVSGTQTFTVGAPTFGLDSMTPAAGNPGAAVPVTFTGHGLTSAMTVSSPAGVTVSNFKVTSATQATALLTIAPAATPGVRSLQVSLAGVGGSAVQFTVNNAPVPTVTSISPATAVPGATVTVTLTGTNFGAGAAVPTVGVSVGTIKTSNVKVVSATQMTVQFAVDAATAPGSYNVVVTQAGLASAPVAFIVAAPPASFASISPASGAAGSAVTVTLTGTNFSNAIAPVVSGSGIVVSAVKVLSATQMTAVFTINATAASGAHTVAPSGASASSSSVSFAVTSGAGLPVVSAMTPAKGLPGSVVPVSFTGANFTAASTVTITGSGVTVSNIKMVSSSSLTAQFTIAATAPVGSVSVKVNTAAGSSQAVPFAISAPAAPMTITSVGPPGAGRGTSVPVTISGTNFAAGLTVTASGTGLTVSKVTVVSATTVTLQIAVDAAATVGARTLTLTNPNGGVATTPFVVPPPAATITSLSPNTGVIGTTVSMTITGTGFLAGSQVFGDGSGVTFANTVVVSSTQITTNVTFGGATGARTLVVGVPAGIPGLYLGGSPATFTLSSQGSAGPVVTSMSPATAHLGSSATVTLTGSGFTPTMKLTVSGVGVTLSNITVLNNTGTKATATLTVTSNATQGPRYVAVGATAAPATGASSQLSIVP